MRPDTLPLLQLWAPLIFVVGAIYLLGPILPNTRQWARIFVFGAVWLIVARYLDWRLFTTVVPVQGAWYEVGWVWFCFAVESLALGEALILYVGFLRTTDRRTEADHHEARLRALSPEQLPAVDVYIPTYNEPIDVLEKTITGALCLDYPNFNLWVLDDGRRPWLKIFCDNKGVGYLTRPDNSDAKAGNINHALRATNAEFIAIFDADVIPQRNFLMRTIGFFSDPVVGIVQVPHAFYNHDPMQTNLALRKALPDDQRFFFEAIMPSRDGWDAAFCCGSNSVTRRAALRAIGDALPTASITEDMLLSLMLLRKGYVTRYLCERLAFGLAPETLQAFFVQRRRWTCGAMQILYLPAGPFGHGLRLMQRLLFLPTHWLSQSLMLVMGVITPLVFLWTGIAPLINVTTESVIHYLVPMVLAVLGGIVTYAPGRYFPLASQVLGTFQSFKILPAALATLVKPSGHKFKVTPKGREAKGPVYERDIFWTAACLLVLTTGGLIINSVPDWRIVTQTSLLPMVACWGVINTLVLLLVCMMSLQAPARRAEERFAIEETIGVFFADGTISNGKIKDLSLSGAAILADFVKGGLIRLGDPISVLVSEVGFIRGTVVRCADRFFAMHFDLRPSVERDLLIRKLFTAGLDTTTVNASAWSVTCALLKSVWSTRSSHPEFPAGPGLTSVALPRSEGQLPAQTLIIPPQRQTASLAELSEQRRKFAA